MATVTKDLGPVTAYKYAVSKGYTGTEEEFAQLMADLANLAPRVTAVEDDVEQVEGTIISQQSQITDMNTVKSTDITFLGNTITVYKYGKMVLFQFFGQSKVELTQNTEIAAGTLPVGYRPTVRCASIMFTSSTSARPQIVFNTSGDITIYSFGGTINANSGWIRDHYVFIAS